MDRLVLFGSVFNLHVYSIYHRMPSFISRTRRKPENNLSVPEAGTGRRRSEVCGPRSEVPGHIEFWWSSADRSILTGP